MNKCTEYFWSACAHDTHSKVGENNNCTCCLLGFLSNYADVCNFHNDINPFILLPEGCVIQPSSRCSRSGRVGSYSQQDKEVQTKKIQCRLVFFMPFRAAVVVGGTIIEKLQESCNFACLVTQSPLQKPEPWSQQRAGPRLFKPIQSSLGA